MSPLHGGIVRNAFSVVGHHPIYLRSVVKVTFPWKSVDNAFYAAGALLIRWWSVGSTFNDGDH